MVVSCDPITVERLQAFAITAKPSVGPISSLGNMPVRNGLLVAITSHDGITGWGEIWCNFPPQGNLNRLNLLNDVIGPELIGMRFSDVWSARAKLEQKFARLAIHTGEFGSFAHCFAGIDTALFEIAAKSKGLSTARFLNPNTLKTVPTYASTPNVADLEASLTDIMANGHTSIKLKLGHGIASDRALVDGVSELGEAALTVYADANQNWSLKQAIASLYALSDVPLGFIEEPLRADAPLADWKTLSEATSIPVAAGENITSRQSFSDFLTHGGLKVVQPDVAKWGGTSGAFNVGQFAKTTGASCFMHFMGSGLGLAASMQVLAAINHSGAVELDSNPNPLRTDLGDIDLSITEGVLQVPQGNGHGFQPDRRALSKFSCGEIELR